MNPQEAPRKLSDAARAALTLCYATRGKHRGQLLARCPRSNTLAAAAWQATVLVVNPYKASVAAMLFMNAEQKAIFNEIKDHIDAMPRAYQLMIDRDREALTELGVW